MKWAGSTLQFQLVAHLVEYAGTGHRVAHVSPDNFPEVRDSYAAETGFKVFKSHACTPEIANLCRSGDGIAFYVYRDLRDVAVSLANKNGVSVDSLLERGTLEDCLHEYALWTKLLRALVMKYEELTADLTGAVRCIADHLGLTLSYAVCAGIAAKYAPDAQATHLGPKG